MFKLSRQQKDHRYFCGNRYEKYSIKKLKVGAASVLIGAGFLFGYNVDRVEAASATETVVKKDDDTGLNQVQENTQAKAVSESKVDNVGEAELAEKPNLTEEPEKSIEQVKPVKENEKDAEHASTGSENANTAEGTTTKPSVDLSLLQAKLADLEAQIERVRENKKQVSQIQNAEKLVTEAKRYLSDLEATQLGADKKAKEISSLTSILKSIKGVEKKEVATKNEAIENSTATKEGLKKLADELTEAVSKVVDLSSEDEKKTIAEAREILKEVQTFNENQNETELVKLYQKVQRSRNSIVNLSTRTFSGKRDVRNGKEIPKEDLRTDASVSNAALYGHLTFLDSNGVNKNISEDTIPVVSNGDGKRVLKLQLGFSSSSATPIKNGKIRYIIPKNHLNTDVKPSLSNSALASGSPKDLSDDNNYIYEIPLNTITGGAVGQLNIEHQISSSIDKSPSAGDTTIARAEFYNGDELISTTTATARYEYLSQILYKESDKKENKNLFDYVPGYYDRDLIVGSKNPDGTFSPIKGNTFTLPFITYDRGKDFLQGTDVGDKNGNGRLTDVDYTITGIPEFLELVPTVETNRYWTLEGNVAKLNYAKTSVDKYKRPTRVGAEINNNGPVFRVKEGYFDTPQKMEQYLSSNGGKKVDIEYKAIGHRPDGSTYTQILATSEALNNQLKFSIGDGPVTPIPAERMSFGVTTPNKQRLFSNQSDTDEFNVSYGYNSGPLRDKNGAMTPRALKGNGDKLDNNYFVYSVPTDKPNTYFTHFQLTETTANVIQKDGTPKLESYNNSEASKQSFNYTFAKPFKLYGVKADGTREELKEMSTANQLYEEVEIDKSKQFTRLVLEHPDVVDKFIEAGDNFVPLGFRSTVRTTMANWQEMAANDNITRHENNIGVSLSTSGNSLDAATTMTYPATVNKNGYNTAVHTKERFTAELAISPVSPIGDKNAASYDANRGSDKNNISRQQIVPFMVRYKASEYYNNAIKTVDGKKVLNNDDLDEKIQNATVMLVADSTLPLTNFRMPMDNKMFSNKFSTQGRANYSAGNYEDVVKDTEAINPDKIIKDYKGTGKTAYIFKAKDLGLKSVDLNLNQLNNDGPVALTFEVVNNGQAENGTYHIDSYLVWDKESQRLVGKDPSLSADILEGHEPGRQVVKATTDVTLKVASEYYTQLTIAKKNEVGVMGIINVKNGEDVVLNPSVVNAADAPALLKEVMVEIPKNYGEPHKVAETSLKGPIPSTADYHVVYTTSKGTNAEKTTAQYVTADQITDWSTVTAVKYVFDREYILHKGEKFQTSFDVHVHEDNPNLVEGQSQVWLKDGKNTWLESNKVGLITEDQRGKLKVRHVNLSGNDIMSETTDKGFQDDPYTSSSYGIIDRANDGKAYIYSHVHNESDPTDGIYEKQQTKKVIYVYVEADRKEERKNVTRTINYVEKDNEGNVIFPQRTYTRPAKRVVYTIKEGPRTGEKIYGPWQRVHNAYPLDWPTEVSPTGNNDYTLVGRKDDEAIKNVEKEPIVTWKSTNEDIQVDPVTGKVTIAADKVKAGTGISVVTKDSNNTLTNVSSTDDAGNKVISPLASETTRLEITYIPKGQKEPITSIVTKEGNRWTTTDTNITVNASTGEVTISKDKREFGQNVTTVAKDSNGNSTTLPAISNKKDAVIRPVSEAYTMDITYTPAGQENPVTVTLSRDIIENKEYTVLYEAKKGSININYEDTDGNVIKAKQAYVSSQKLRNATDVDGAELTGPNKSSFSMGALQGEKKEKFRPDKITLEDGKIYNLRRVKPNTPRDYGNLVEGTTEITYVYELAKGTVRVKYQDTDGRGFGLADKVIKDNVPTGEAYDTTTSENKPTRYETNDGKIYELVTTAKTDGNVQYDANGVRTNVNQATKAEPSGTVAEGNKEITYIYELKKGSVVVHYIDTEGNKIKDDRTDKDNVSTGTQYNVTDATNKPAKITTAEGKVFELVTEAKTEGEVQYDATGLKKDSAAVEGRVKAETLEVTYVYKEKKSGVNVKYVDSQGRPIAGTATMPNNSTEEVTVDGLKPVTDASVNSDYTVTDKKASKITTADGKVYRLIADRDGLQAGSKPATGKVEENEITVTYQYELLGSVVTKYELSDGTKLTGELTFDNATTPTTVEEKGLAVANATDVSNGTNYDATTSANKPNKITTATGEVYYLTTANNGVKADSAPVTGTVEEGKTKEVTYVYEKAGSVVIKYINTDGTEIKTSVQDSTNVKPGTDYNAAETDEKPATIEFNNKKYKLVTKAGTTTTNATYSAEAVVTNGENVGAATGQVVSGKTLEVTYVYEEVKGNVLVKYVDETGAPLAGTATMPGDTTETVTAAGVTAVTEAELGTSYDNKVAEKKATKITTADGKVYELVTENNGLYNTSEPETGTVTEADKVVTFVYKEKKSAVNVKYVDKAGQPLAGTATMPGDTTENVTTDGLKPVTNASVNSDYNVADKKASKITTADGKVYRLITEHEGLLDGSKPVSGKVEENEITVTYQYELVNGNVTVTYKDTEGNKIEGYETPKDAEKDAPTGKDFNTATEALKPAKITTASGKVYNLVPESTEGNETGKVTETPQNVTYVYKLAKGDVTVTYKDTEGNTIEGYEKPKDAEKDAPTGTDFNTATEALKPTKITTPSGKVYNLVPESTEGNETGKVTETPQNVTYVYKLAKGDVTVTYKDTEGNTIEGYEKPKDAEKDAPTGTDFNTATEALKPSKITTPSGKVYNLVPESTEGNETGKVTETPQNVTYVYKLAKGDVTVTYKDTEGNTIEGYEKPKDAEKDAPTGTDFNTATEALKPTKITTPSGKVYNLVPESTEGNETGKVTETPQNVTYVYKLAKGDVTVTYKDTEGNTIEGYEKPKDAEKDAPTGTDFNTATEALKPTKITTPSGKVYNLVPESTEGNETGKVTETPQNVTYVYKLAKGDVTVTYKDTEGNTIEGYETPKDAEKDAPTGTDFNTATDTLKPAKITTPSGKVYNLVPARTEGTESGKVTETPQNVTYVYELAKGDVTVTYKDTEGNKIPGYETPKTVESQSPTGKEYTTATEALKPSKITTPSGKVYNLVPARTEGTESGKVTETPQNVTYVYELAKGNVTVTYKDTEGNPIEGYETPKDAEKDAPTGKEFNTATEALKPSKITTPSGKVYNLVPERTEGTESGKVTETPQNVTYVYELAKGDVTVTYKDTEGNKIPGYETPKTVESQSPTGKEYTTVTEALKPSKITTPDGKVYNLVPTRTEGNENGKVTETPQNVTYVYELAKGNVTVTYKDTEGNTIEGYEKPKDAEKDAPTGTDFNTATEALKPTKITTPSGKVYNLVPARTEGNESGKVTETPQNVTYVYELAKGDVTVSYKDTEGNKIPGYETPKTVETQSPTGKEYTTATEALKPSKITTPSGKVYNLVPARTEGNETGKVTETPQNVTYVYKLAKGDVTVTYKDTEGNTIEGYEKPKDAEKDAPTGTDFNTATEALKPTKITTPSGKVYNLVPESTEGNETGKVTETPQNVTYVYKLAKGDVTVTYKDTEGNTIEGYETPKDAEKDAPTGTDFNTATDTLKPAKITTPSGKVYNLVPARTEGTESGKVTETPQNVTYVYELAKGDVTVTYKDTEGNKIPGYETPKTVESQSPTGKEYTTATEALKPSKITTPSGKVYNLVPARTEGTESGKVTETPQNVTYVYELAKGNVTVTYKDTEGNPIEGYETPKDAEKDAPTGKEFNTATEALKPSKITTPSGKVYNLVPERTEGTESGKVTETPQNVTYVYELAKGDVTVTYKDTEGNKIPGYETPKTVESQSPTGKEYTTVTEALKPSKITTPDGKVYNLVPTRTEGNENGKVTETPQNVTYVYELAKGNVTVTYKDTEGNTIEGYEKPKDAEKDAPTGTDFNTATEALKPTKITTPSGKVYNLVPARTEGNESGKVTETPQNVTYVYELAKGDVTVSYKDTEGNKIPGYETPKTVETQSPTGKEYTTATEALKPSKITTPSGKVYNLVPARTEGTESGKVTETPQNVTYVYELAKGNVTVTYKDTEGNTIEGYETPKDAEKDAPTGKDFNTATDTLKPAKITTPSGKVYNLVPARTEGTESGKVTEQPQNVTYVYELAKGDVTVTYKDTEGNTIEGYETPKDAEKDAPTGTDFNTATDTLKPAKITTPSGKVYNLVPARTEGTESGKVTETPQNVTYVYELAKGDVTVTYKDTEGNKIPGYETPKTVESQSPTGKEYTTATEALKPSKITTPSGKVYNLVPARTEGTESGKVTETPQNVTYVYELAKGNVTVTYKDTEGNPIEGYETPKDAEKDAPTGKEFNTATEALKPSKITTPSGKVYNLVPERTEGTESGKVTETPQNVTYVYELAKGDVTVTYKDTEGNKIPGYETPKTVESQSPTGKEYTTATEALKPSKITTPSGKVYNLVPTRTEGNEKGKVTENPQNVTYVYEAVKEPEIKQKYGKVIVTYIDKDGHPLSGTTETGVKVDKSVIDTSASLVKTLYDTTDHRPATIITENGDVYEFVKKSETSDPESGELKEGVTTVEYVYRKVVTTYVDETGKEINPSDKGTKNKKDIPEYTFKETKKDKDGNTIHVYTKKSSSTPDSPKPSIPSNEESKSTIWKDTEGNVLKPQEDGTKDKGTFTGYEYVKTILVGNVTTHIFKKVITPSHDGTPSHSDVTVTSDKSTQIANSNESTFVDGKRELPNTGTQSSTSSLLLGALAAMTGLGLVSRRRKDDKE